MNLKGSLPALILETLARGSNHGYAIAQDIKKRSEGVLDFKEGTLYPALHTLEQAGLIEAWDHEEKGRLRRCYKLTHKGQSVLEREKGEWKRLSGAIGGILGGTA